MSGHWVLGIAAIAALVTGCATEEVCERPGQMKAHVLDVEGADSPDGDLLAHGTIVSPERHTLRSVELQIGGHWDVLVPAYPEDGFDLRVWAAPIGQGTVSRYMEDGALEIEVWALDACMEDRDLPAVPTLDGDPLIELTRAPDPADLDPIELEIAVEWPVPGGDADGLAPSFLAEGQVAPVPLIADADAAGVVVSLTAVGGNAVVTPAEVVLEADGAGNATATALLEVERAADVQLLAVAGPHEALIVVPVRSGPEFLPGASLNAYAGSTIEAAVMAGEPARVRECWASSPVSGASVFVQGSLVDLMAQPWGMAAAGGTLLIQGPNSEIAYEVLVTCTDDRDQRSDLRVVFSP
ncbi:MAG: hypothetical protein GY898_01525 [Proteobacteria bacterium]|nr:hypothetical protein [Pseudomonadota bacterium]